MEITMIKCDKCGEIYNKQPARKFADRDYIGWGNAFHFCKECAKTTTVYEIIHRQAKEKE